MSDKPDRAWEAAKAMYFEETGRDFDALPPADPEKQRWLRLATIGMEAADNYSWIMDSDPAFQ